MPLFRVARLFAGVVLGLFVACPLWAGESFARLVQRLATDKDFRVRTQAALALGSLGEARATKPLCNALSDKSVTVRSAAAAALGKLNQGGVDCLRKRLGEESSARVKASIRRALRKLVPLPQLGPEVRYYIAIGPVTLAGEDESHGERVRAAMVKAAATNPELAVAPVGELADEAEARLSRHASVRGFLLSPTLQGPRYEAGNLKCKLDVAVSTYPEGALLGSYSVDLTARGGGKRDEALLVSMVAERAVHKFSLNASKF